MAVTAEIQDESRPLASHIGQNGIKAAVIVVIILVDSIWIAATDFRFDIQSAVLPGVLTLLMLGFGWFYAARRPMPAINVMCVETGFLLSFSAACAVLSYLAASLALPLIDSSLLAADRAIGFDWAAYVGFIGTVPWLGTLSSLIYVSTLSQVALTIVVLGLYGHSRRSQTFNTAVILGALVCVIVSALLPAAGALATLRPDASIYGGNVPIVDLAYKQVFFDVRSGAERLISLDQLHGLIAFPSYHCVLSTLIPLAFWPIKRLFWPLAFLNGLIVLSTPLDGGHHLVDGLAGVVVGLSAWWIAMRLHAEKEMRRPGQRLMPTRP